MRLPHSATLLKKKVMTEFIKVCFKEIYNLHTSRYRVLQSQELSFKIVIQFIVNFKTYNGRDVLYRSFEPWLSINKILHSNYQFNIYRGGSICFHRNDNSTIVNINIITFKRLFMAIKFPRRSCQLSGCPGKRYLYTTWPSQSDG